MSSKSTIHQREYQQAILLKLKENFSKKLHTITEVDTGLGKRVLSFLLVKEVLIQQRILLLLHSTTSFAETIHYFKEKYGGFNVESEFQSFSSRTPSMVRNKILENKQARIVASTPQTFFNAFSKYSEEDRPYFDVVIINEIDKIVRRQGSSRLLIYPYNTLVPIFIEAGSWIVGMTGTIRDKHVLYNPNTEKIEIKHELVTIDSRIPDLNVIRMEYLLKQTDLADYIQYTEIKKHEVQPSEELKKILDLIDEAIVELRKNIIEETLEERPTLLDSIPLNQLPIVSGMLEADQSQKYQGLLLIRKYCTAMQAKKYRKFLYRLKKFGVTKDLISALPEQNAKVKEIIKIVQNQSNSSKTVILCSYLDTAHLLKRLIEKEKISTFLVTGEVRNKGIVLNKFKKSPRKSVLVMTSVGERDIDLPEAKLLIIYDTINTVKTMYQRMKRTRGGEVICLFYDGTFEERKVKRVLQEISKNYPWSSIIE